MQLFGFCERSFHGFLAPGVDAFAAACLRKRIRLLPMHPAIHGASPAFCRNGPGSISPVWGNPCMSWSRSSIPDSLPGWSCAMSARALADTGKRFRIRIIGETVFPEMRLPCAYASGSLLPAVSRLRHQLVTHRRAVVSRVQPHVLGLLSQPLFNILEYLVLSGSTSLTLAGVHHAHLPQCCACCPPCGARCNGSRPVCPSLCSWPLSGSRLC